jgi:hypothetical protein
MSKELKKAIEIPLTNFDLEKYLDKNAQDNILKYSELDDYTDLEELLPHHKSYKILLIEYEKQSGHWICILRYGKTIEIFNSFGAKPSWDDFIDSKVYNKYLGQYALFLNKLIKKEKDEKKFVLIYNQIQFQKKSHKVNTCGRHVINRILCMLYFDMNLDDYIKFMKKSKKDTGFNYDEIVTKIIT